jgi:hypothetical protein
MCRRGPPALILSDNGTNFHGAEGELRTALGKINQTDLVAKTQYTVPGQRITEWRFITPRAPHMGGAWERMVRTVKNVLYSVVKERFPREEILRNLLVEVENIINSRPLTYLPISPETNEALTPNHILRMSGKILTSPIPSDANLEIGRKSWRYSQQLANQFWKRFVLEYLPEVTRRTKWHQDTPPLKVGDCVLLIDESAPRNVWEKGVIEVLIKGNDGKARTAEVRTARARRRRPVAKLALLEMDIVGNPQK